MKSSKQLKHIKQAINDGAQVWLTGCVPLGNWLQIMVPFPPNCPYPICSLNTSVRHVPFYKTLLILKLTRGSPPELDCARGEVKTWWWVPQSRGMIPDRLYSPSALLKPQLFMRRDLSGSQPALSTSGHLGDEERVLSPSLASVFTSRRYTRYHMFLWFLG